MERRLVGGNAQRQRELDRLRADARKTESGAARLGEYHEQVRRAPRHSAQFSAIRRNSAQFSEPPPPTLPRAAARLDARPAGHGDQVPKLCAARGGDARDRAPPPPHPRRRAAGGARAAEEAARPRASRRRRRRGRRRRRRATSSRASSRWSPHWSSGAPTWARSSARWAAAPSRPRTSPRWQVCGRQRLLPALPSLTPHLSRPSSSSRSGTRRCASRSACSARSRRRPTLARRAAGRAARGGEETSGVGARAGRAAAQPCHQLPARPRLAYARRGQDPAERERAPRSSRLQRRR